MHGLSIFKRNHPEGSVPGFRHEPPQHMAAGALLTLLKGSFQHPKDPGDLNARVLLTHHLSEVGRHLHAESIPSVCRLQPSFGSTGSRPDAAAGSGLGIASPA
jgi:hypothetical protein